MKKIKVVKLKTRCKDKATGLDGTITHWIIGMGGYIQYFFQPKILNEEGQPARKLYLEVERLDVSDQDFEEVEVPFEILGTIVTDDASGFTGMAVSFLRHINGCFHVFIQPKGLQKKSNSPIDKTDFDLRGCSGEMIKELSKEDLAKSEQETPSPSGGDFNTSPSFSSLTHEE